LCQ
jgi:hypothetical protein